MDPQVNAYYLESEIHGNRVTHPNSGIINSGCMGTWKKCRRLESEHGISSVDVQCLVTEKGSNRPPVYRAVKRIRFEQGYPAGDNKPMITRGILCMARANVSDTIAVVRMLGWYQDDESVYIAMEYYPYGNLGQWVLSAPIQSESWAREVIKQILGVLDELDRAQLAHRNIKPSNIMIASLLPIRVKVGDFHNAKWMVEGKGLGTQVGVLPYVAPEMRGVLDPDNTLVNRYNTKVDIWSLGIILHQILTKMHPFREPGRSMFSDRQYDRFMASKDPVSMSALSGSVSAHGISFVACMLARNPDLRPTPAQALNAPWFMHDILPV